MAKMLINISTKASCFVFLLVALMSATGAAFAQIAQPDNNVKQAAVQLTSTVTASATTERVRFTAPSNITSMRIEVFNEIAEKVFDSNVHAGNLFDWQLQGGQSLSDGTYLCLVTVQSLSGKVSRKLGTVSVAHQQLLLRPASGSQLAPMQKQTLAAAQPDGESTELIEPLIIIDPNQPVALTAIAHDGNDGQVIRSKGALSFRVGDFFSGNDKEQMRLTEEGRLGIGTDDPQATLDVAGTIRAERVLIARPKLTSNDKSGANATNVDDSAQPLTSGTGTQNHLAKWIDGAGTLGDSVAIDTGTGLQLTAAPSASVDTNLLYMNSTNGTIGVLGGSTPSYGAANGPFFAMRGNSYTTIAGQRGIFTISAGNVSSPAGTEGSIKFNTGNDQVQMVVNPAGNVGIGTTSPSEKLEVSDNTSALLLSTTFSGTNGFIGRFARGTSSSSSATLVGDTLSFFGGRGFSTGFGFSPQSSAAIKIQAAEDFTSSGMGARIIFETTETGAPANERGERMRIEQNGNVGIGVQAPQATLHVVSFHNTAADNTATFEAPNIGSNQSHIHWGTTGDWYIRSAVGTGKVILEDTGGNVGIGTASPDQKLTVNGEADKPGGGSWATFSDERLKTIKGRFTPGLKAVMQLQPVRYEYKPDNALGLRSEGVHIGFGAQAVQRIIPEAVTKNDKGYLLVNNDPILWTMLNAIKEQQKEIEDQHQQLQQKRAQMEKLETRLAALEMMLRKSSRQRPRR